LQQQQQQKRLPSKQKTSPVSYAFEFLRSEDSQKQYPKKVKLLFDYLGLEGKNLEQQGQAFLEKAREDQHWPQEVIMDFLDFQKKRVQKGELAAGTLKNIYQPIKLFCELHDLTAINWRRISMSLPKARKESDDRCPTLEEIRKLVEFPDRRIKPIVYTMLSSGIRVGAWDFLKWKHVTPMNNDKGELLAAKLTVYAGEREEHYSFITPEAYRALKDWMEFRALYHEKITPDSPLMRDLWRTVDIRIGEKGGGINGVAIRPEPLSSGGVRKLLLRALIAQGIFPPLPRGVRRHEFKAAHGLRKYFKTYAESAGMKTSFIEFFMNHTKGVEGSYHKPPIEFALTEYLKAVEKLEINDDKLTLQKQIAELTERSKEENYVIKGKLSEKDRELQLLRQRDELNNDALAALSERLMELEARFEQQQPQRRKD
jgi:integrase